MSSNELPMDYMAIEPVRQGSTSLSLSIVAGASSRMLNSDYLRVVSFEGQESVSEPYSFTITLRANEFNPLSKSTANLHPNSDFADLPEQAYSTTDWLQLIQGTANALLGQWASVTLGNEYHPPSANDKVEAFAEEVVKEISDEIKVLKEELDILQQLFPQPVWIPIVTVPTEIATEIQSGNSDIEMMDSEGGAQVFVTGVNDSKTFQAPSFFTASANATLPQRHFSGLVTSISQSAPGEYTLTMQSPLYPLTLRNKYHIYSGLDIKMVIKALISPELERYSKNYSVQFNLKGLATTRTQDWMQAGESDFAMLQRIMKIAAVHFYFIYKESGVTVVFSNQPSSPKSVIIPGTKAGSLSLRYSYTDATALNLQQNDLFCNLSYQVQMTSRTLGPINSILTRQESVWETNNVASFASYSAQDSSLPTTFHHHRIFNYGLEESHGSSEASETLVQLQQELASQQSVLNGECTSNLLSPGYTFTLSQQAVDPKNPVSNLMPTQFDGQTFVVTKIKHQVSESSPYSGTVEASPIPKGVDTSSPDATLITPFEMSDTRQGTVLARVLQTGVLNSPYFYEKSNYDPQTSSVQYDGSTMTPAQMGCIVKFATDEGTDITHWVVLSDSSQSVPAVNSMVLIGRNDTESELPQIQQVVASHGEKTIQPPLWKGNSWSFNTHWGSSCNTSYSDSMNIHFGSEVTAQLDVATKIVKDAYLNTGPLSAGFGSANYDKGCSFSYSTTENAASGLANASVSQGCHFSESYSDQDYSLSYTDARQSFSKTNKSVNVSYMGTYTDAPDESNLSFIKGKIPKQHIIDLCNELPSGSSYDQSHITGKTISLSGHGTTPPSISPSSVTSDSYSNSKMVGDSEDIHSQTGNTDSTSTITGNTTNTSTVTGTTTSSNTVSTASINVSGIGIDAPAVPTSTTAVSYSHSKITGDSDDTHEQTGNTDSTSTITGNTTNTSTITLNSTNTNTVKGKSINVSGVGTQAPAAPSSTTAVSYSHTKITGNSDDTHEQTGDTTSTSTITGNTTNTSTITVNSTNSNTINGKSINVSGIGASAPAAPTSTSAVSYSHTVITGNSDDTHDQTGDTNSHTTITGSQTQYMKVTANSKNTNIVNGNSTNISENYGEVKHTETHHGHKEMNVTHRGTKNSISKTLAASHELETALSASSTEKIIGGISNEIKSFNGLSNEVNQHSGPSNTTKIGPASAFTDERPQAIQVSAINITVTGIISIL